MDKVSLLRIVYMFKGGEGKLRNLDSFVYFIDMVMDDSIGFLLNLICDFDYLF